MNSVRFLLVDDEKEFIEVIVRRLRQRGFIAECAFSGAEALDMLENDDAFDVVLLDVKMPDLDGIQTIEIIKKKHPLIEVIMLTGHAAVHSAVDAMKLGAYDYLTKPCDLDVLILKAEQAVSKKKEREAKIFDARIKPYISARERNELITTILNNKK